MNILIVGRCEAIGQRTSTQFAAVVTGDVEKKIRIAEAEEGIVAVVTTGNKTMSGLNKFGKHRLPIVASKLGFSRSPIIPFSCKLPKAASTASSTIYQRQRESACLHHHRT